MKQKSSIFNLDANIVVLISYLGGLILKWIHIACYFAWIIPLIIYLAESKNEFVKKQSAQATLLYLVNSIFTLFIYILLIIFAPSNTADIYNMIVTGSLLLVGLISIIATILAIAITIFSTVATIKTYNYEDYNIPYISKYISKFRKYLDILEGKNKHQHTSHEYKEKQKTTYKKVKPHKIRIKKYSTTSKVKGKKINI